MTHTVSGVRVPLIKWTATGLVLTYSSLSNPVQITRLFHEFQTYAWPPGPQNNCSYNISWLNATDAVAVESVMSILTASLGP